MVTSTGTTIDDRIRRRAELISEQTDLLEQELLADEEVAYCTNVQGVVYDCVALGNQWRAVVQAISNDMEFVNLSSLRTSLEPMAHRTIELCESIQPLAYEAPCQIDGKTDIEILKHEVQNILAWISEWPSSDSTSRDASRREIAEGKVLDADRFCIQCSGNP